MAPSDTRLIVGTGVAAIGFFIGGPVGFYIGVTGVALFLGAVLEARVPRFSQAVAGTQVSRPFPNKHIPVIYGSARIAPTLIYISATSSGGSFTFNDLWLVGVLSHGEVEAIDEVYFDNVKVFDAAGVPIAGTGYYTSSPTDNIEVFKYVGTDSQVADTNIPLADWTSAHKGQGIAYIVLKIRREEGFKTDHVPNITVNIRGKKCFDPRTSTTIYTTNPIICLRDYMTNARYGMGAAVTEIDDTLIQNEANHCDELVTVPDGMGGSTTQKRFQMTGIVDTGKDIKANLESMMSSCRGQLVFYDGKYHILIRKTTAASAFELNEDNIVGQWKFSTPGIGERINKIDAAWINPDQNYQADLVEWPRAGASNQYLTDDNGFELQRHVVLPFTQNPYTAEQIIMVMRHESRFAVGCSLVAKEEALKLTVGEIVKVTHATPGWTTKEFWVAAIGIGQNGLVSLGLIEYQSAAYSK